MTTTTFFGFFAAVFLILIPFLIGYIWAKVEDLEKKMCDKGS